MRLLQANTFTLHKLGLIKLAYDHIFNKTYGYERIQSSIFHISKTQFWKEKSYSNPEMTENQRKNVIRKVILFIFKIKIILINIEKICFSTKFLNFVADCGLDWYG